MSKKNKKNKKNSKPKTDINTFDSLRKLSNNYNECLGNIKVIENTSYKSMTFLEKILYLFRKLKKNILLMKYENKLKFRAKYRKFNLFEKFWMNIVHVLIVALKFLISIAGSFGVYYFLRYLQNNYKETLNTDDYSTILWSFAIALFTGYLAAYISIIIWKRKEKDNKWAYRTFGFLGINILWVNITLVLYLVILCLEILTKNAQGVTLFLISIFSFIGLILNIVYVKKEKYLIYYNYKIKDNKNSRLLSYKGNLCNLFKNPLDFYDNPKKIISKFDFSGVTFIEEFEKIAEKSKYKDLSDEEEFYENLSKREVRFLFENIYSDSQIISLFTIYSRFFIDRVNNMKSYNKKIHINTFGEFVSSYLKFLNSKVFDNRFCKWEEKEIDLLCENSDEFLLYLIRNLLLYIFMDNCTKKIKEAFVKTFNLKEYYEPTYVKISDNIEQCFLLSQKYSDFIFGNFEKLTNSFGRYSENAKILVNQCAIRVCKEVDLKLDKLKNK